MSHEIKQLAHVCIFSSDLERTRRFYEDLLGLRTVFRFTREGEVFGFYLEVGGRTQVEVFRNTEAEARGTDRINHLCLEVADIRATAEHLRALDVAVREPRKACDDTWQAWISDPDGTRIELFEYTDKSAQFAGGDREADW